MKQRKQIKQTQTILDNCIKRIVRTHSEIITAETGIWDIETQVAKKQISHYHTILTIETPESQLYKSAMEPKNTWRMNVKRRTKHTNRRATVKKQDTSQQKYTKQPKINPT